MHSKMAFLSIFFLFFIHEIQSYQLEADQFLTPEEIRENVDAFQFEDRRYVIYNIPVSFDEAVIICQQKGKTGSLAILYDNDLNEFAAIALAETGTEQSHYWIGARQPPGQTLFHWLNGFPVETVLMEALIVNRTNSEPNPNRTCLGIERKHHEKPQFVDLDCSLQRPFICEHELLSSSGPVLQNSVSVGSKEYFIYYAHATWNVAVAYCREYDMRLATFEDTAETNLVGRRLLKSRPSIEMAWIGAKYDNDKWMFFSTQVEITNKTSPTTLFPPWFNNGTDKVTGCILLDRHLAAYPVFLPARCDRKRSFVCEREVKQNGPALAVSADGQGFALFYENKTWLSAKSYCESNEMKLAEPKTSNDLYRIILLMAENITVVSHVWLGADWGSTLENPRKNDWRWSSNSKPLPGYMADMPFLFYASDITFKRQCLNLDRENHNELLLYGLACNITQYFVCENLDGKPLPLTVETMTPRPRRYYAPDVMKSNQENDKALSGPSIT